jgi:ActR/RegA family two-component response regulator
MVALMQPLRVLFVDDEPGIRQTMPQILEHHGFVVSTASTVNGALGEITSNQFDVLISDLNIGEPGDGFVVVSAMRRTQPNCVTIILTGYPGFESALQAIRSQVDDYLIKPAAIPGLLKMIEDRIKEPKPGRVEASKRISDILRENTFEVAQKALTAMKADPVLSAVPVTDQQRIENIPHVLTRVAKTLESADTEPADSAAVAAAEALGRKRYGQGYEMVHFLTHARLIQGAIYHVIHENLLSLNLSYFMLDLKRLNDVLGILFEHTVRGYIEAEKTHQPKHMFHQHR